MKKLLFAASILVSLLCSCGEKETPVDETPDKLVIKLEAPFSNSDSGKEIKTSFESLKVKAVVKIDNEIIPQAVTASNGYPWTFEKEVSLSGKTSISFELYPEFSLKDENNLPTTIDLGFSPKGTFTFYKNGNEVKASASKVQINWQKIGSGGYKAKEQGIDNVKKFLEKQKEKSSKGTIAW